VTEVPEHLLRRSQERRAAMGLGPEPGDAGAAPSSESAASSTEIAPAASAAPAAPAGSAPLPVPAKEADAPPPPPAPYVQAAERRKRIPIWALPVLASLPVWAFLYVGTLDPKTSAASDPVTAGAAIYTESCAACHGVFGESNEYATPLVGGTTARDSASGRVAALADAYYPVRSTLMKLPTLSSLFDYIRRAMPWNNPKTLSDDDVYAVTAYVLNLGGIMADGETLSEQNVREIQQRLPNRNGMTTDHGLWPGRGFGRHGQPDVRAVACMTNCATAATVASSLPEHARNAHGNLAEQNRSVGPQRGADTTRPAPATLALAAAAMPAAVTLATPSAAPAPHAGVGKLLQTHNCMACHGMDRKLVGPSLTDVAKRYAGRSGAVGYLDGRIRAGGVGVWGPIAMPAQNLPPADAQAIALWLANGAPALTSTAQPSNSPRK